MQHALRPYAIAGIAMLGAGGFIAFTPVAPPLPDLQVPAIQLTSDTGLGGDIGGLLDSLTGAGGSSGTDAGLLGGLGLGNVLGGLDPGTALGGLGSGDLGSLLGGLGSGDLGSLLGGLGSGGLGGLLGGLGLGSVGGGGAAAPGDLLTPYVDLFTHTFANLQAIGGERLADPAPILAAIFANQLGYFQQVIANPASIVDIPGEMAGHLQNVFAALANPLSVTVGPLTSLPVAVNVMLGVPLVLGLAALGPLVTTSGAVADLFGALGSGDPSTAIAALVDAPATIPDSFLNGSIGLDLLGLKLPLLNGILVPDQNLDLSVGTGLINQLLTSLGLPALLPSLNLADVTVGPFGGLTDALVNFVPQQIAAALGEPVTGMALGTGLFGNLLDPTTLLGDLTGLLPGAAADLPGGLAADLVPNLAGMLLDPLTLIGI